MGWVVNGTPRPLYHRERPGTHCIGGWVGVRTGLDGFGKSRYVVLRGLEGCMEWCVASDGNCFACGYSNVAK